MHAVRSPDFGAPCDERGCDGAHLYCVGITRDMPTIPRVVYQTTNYSRAVVPDLWGAAADGFRFECSNNAGIARSMHNFSRAVSAIFDSVSGIHQCNLWHAASLYRHGGVYLDIKTIGVLPLQHLIAEHHNRPTVYTVASRLHGKTTIHIGIMAATARHPLIREWLDLLLRAGIKGELSHFKPNLVVCDAFYNILQAHFGLPDSRANLTHRAKAGVYESASGGRLVLWEDHTETTQNSRCSWRHTGYRPMFDRYHKCQLIFNSSIDMDTSMPIMGLRDPTYPQSWAQRELNLSLGLPLDFSPAAKAPLGLTTTPGDGFSAMSKRAVGHALSELKATIRNSSADLSAVRGRLKATKIMTEDEDLSAIIAPEAATERGGEDREWRR